MPLGLSYEPREMPKRFLLADFLPAYESSVPDLRITHEDNYRNYKGWGSTLVVAFVNAFHLFVDVDVGFPGRSGDNTVLNHYSWIMDQIKADPEAWLGKDGVVLGDGGASDGDGVFMNPYCDPKTPGEGWFNFCHSSTRFVVEETFGS